MLCISRHKDLALILALSIYKREFTSTQSHLNSQLNLNSDLGCFPVLRETGHIFKCRSTYIFAFALFHDSSDFCKCSVALKCLYTWDRRSCWKDFQWSCVCLGWALPWRSDWSSVLIIAEPLGHGLKINPKGPNIHHSMLQKWCPSCLMVVRLRV